MTANELKRVTEKYLNARGWKVWRTNAGYSGRYNVKLSPSGTADIIGYDTYGYFAGIEIKIGTDRLRPSQIEWLKKLNETEYGYGVIITCVDDVIQLEKERR
ncbi:MAG: hypothetical protein DRN81_03115 [Thermoproteota archaeon]|nr:MAG: hypothetical protein DRN81_03115 [Candidatus Korarchaeota archaeon]